LQSKSLQYVLPTFVDGLSLKYQTGLGAQTDNTSNSNHYAADFKTGAFAAGVAYSDYKQTSSTTDSANTYYATYDMGAVKLLTLWGSAKTAGASTVNSTSIGFQVPMGAATFMYNNSSSDGRVYNNIVTTGTASIAASTVSSVDQAADFIGVSYKLAPRTTAYAAYFRETGNDSTGKVAGIAASSNWSTTRFIVIHSF